jgi:hypothetical protein
MSKGTDPTLAGCFNDPVKKLKRLREQHDILKQTVRELEGKIRIVEHELRECGENIPSSVLECCGMCQPYCIEKCGTRKQCLIEQEKPPTVFDLKDWPRKL